jgi:hypothetical protein
MSARTPMGQVIKNMIRSISGVSFPLAGSIVVIYTLSGRTRTVAIIATIVAIVGHVVHSTLDLNDAQVTRNPFSVGEEQPDGNEPNA